MHYDQIAQIAAVVIGVGSISISGILWNVVQAYKVRVEQLQESHTENLERIKELEGVVKAFRDVPLRDMSKTQKEILETQKEILSFIKEMKT